MPKKRSSDKMASLAGRVMDGYVPNAREIKSLAASVLSQDEHEGKRVSKPAKTAKKKVKRKC